MLLTMMIAAQVAASNPKASEPPSAAVTHKGSLWQIDYTLPHDAPAWVFPVSAPQLMDHRPWRQGAWQVATPGVRIERHGAYDMLVASDGRSIPRKVRITFTPTSATLEREYDPAIAFSNGATALYSDQFDLAPINDPATVDAKETGLSVQDFGGRSVPVRFRDDAGPVFVQGKRQNDPILTGAATYVVFGAGKVQTLGGVAMLADPALPAWLKTDVSQFAPRVASTYASRLGARSDPRLPLLIMGWRGATPGKVINDGGARPGEIVLNFEGEGLLERNERAARRTRWFIAHEMAHFWLGSEGVGYVAPSDAWITEGGAEMMAFTLLAAANHEYVIGELQRAVDDCVKLGTKVRSSSGVTFDSISADSASAPDTLVVVGGEGSRTAMHCAGSLAYLRGWVEQVRRMCRVCSGAFVLAAVGLLDGRRATTHWRRAEQLRRHFPAVRVEPDRIHVRDGAIWTSAGSIDECPIDHCHRDGPANRAYACAVNRRFGHVVDRPSVILNKRPVSGGAS